MHCGRQFSCRAYRTGCTHASPVENERRLLGFLTTQASRITIGFSADWLKGQCLDGPKLILITPRVLPKERNDG
jgi:hypothetical protein